MRKLFSWKISFLNYDNLFENLKNRSSNKVANIKFETSLGFFSIFCVVYFVTILESLQRNQILEKKQ